MIDGKKTIECYADLTPDRTDLEKIVEIKLDYNVYDSKNAKIRVKPT